MKKLVQLMVVVVSINSTAAYCWEWPWTLYYNKMYSQMNGEEKQSLFRKEVTEASVDKSIKNLEKKRKHRASELSLFIADRGSYYYDLPPLSDSDRWLSRNERSINEARRRLNETENSINALLKFDIHDLDQKHANILRKDFRQLEQEFQNKYGLTYQQMKEVNKGFDSYFVRIQKKPVQKKSGWSLFSPMEEPTIQPAQPSLMQTLKDWFAQKRDTTLEFKIPSLNLQQKLQMAQQAAAQSTKIVAERIAEPSAQAQYDFARTPEGETFAAPRPVQKYEIIPGSPADRMRQWWNKR